MTGDPKSQYPLAEYSSGLQLIKSELVSLIALQNPHLHRSDAEQIVETVLGTSGASRFRHILNPKPALSLGAKPSEWRNGEETGLPYASIHPNRFHGCGHDAHTAILLGAASFHALLSGGLGPILHQPGRPSGNLRRNPNQARSGVVNLIYGGYRIWSAARLDDLAARKSFKQYVYDAYSKDDDGP
jgi:hypothetical protein